VTSTIGLLGGSFDPVHAGHLQLARDALRALPLSEVRFLPAAQPWQKPALTDAVHRMRMLQLAIAGEPHFALDVREIGRGGPTYTIDTLRDLRAALDATTSLVWITGSDQFEQLETWRDWEAIPQLTHIALAQRAGRPMRLSTRLATLLAARRQPPEAITKQPAGAIVEFAMTPIDVSATEVRRLLAFREAPDPVAGRLQSALPGPVLDYIRAHHLYR
jgi:nicotinate-nucleotide adenylyltransferase